jgi:hypothetical protein
MNDRTATDLPERLRKLYSSREALEETIRAIEARVVRSVRAIIKAGTLLQDVEVLRELERNLEWFLTWRLKLADTPSVMWCDGVIDLAIHSQGDLSYEISARAYIGPESATDTTLWTLAGTIVLDKIADRLRAYKLTIAYEGESFVITDAI